MCFERTRSQLNNLIEQIKTRADAALYIGKIPLVFIYYRAFDRVLFIMGALSGCILHERVSMKLTAYSKTGRERAKNTRGDVDFAYIDQLPGLYSGI